MEHARKFTVDLFVVQYYIFQHDKHQENAGYTKYARLFWLYILTQFEDEHLATRKGIYLLFNEYYKRDEFFFIRHLIKPAAKRCCGFEMVKNIFNCKFVVVTICGTLLSSVFKIEMYIFRIKRLD